MNLDDSILFVIGSISGTLASFGFAWINSIDKVSFNPVTYIWVFYIAVSVMLMLSFRNYKRYIMAIYGYTFFLTFFILYATFSWML